MSFAGCEWSPRFFTCPSQSHFHFAVTLLSQHARHLAPILRSTEFFRNVALFATSQKSRNSSPLCAAKCISVYHNELIEEATRTFKPACESYTRAKRTIQGSQLQQMPRRTKQTDTTLHLCICCRVYFHTSPSSFTSDGSTTSASLADPDEAEGEGEGEGEAAGGAEPSERAMISYTREPNSAGLSGCAAHCKQGKEEGRGATREEHTVSQIPDCRLPIPTQPRMACETS